MLRNFLSLKRAKMAPAFVGAVLMSALLYGQVFAVEAADLDWSADLTTGIAGITAGVAASIGAVFAVAVLVRLTFKAARIALKAIGFIK